MLSSFGEEILCCKWFSHLHFSFGWSFLSFLGSFYFLQHVKMKFFPSSFFFWLSFLSFLGIFYFLQHGIAVTSGNYFHLCCCALFGFCKIVNLLVRQVIANSNNVSADRLTWYRTRVYLVASLRGLLLDSRCHLWEFELLWCIFLTLFNALKLQSCQNSVTSW